MIAVYQHVYDAMYGFYQDNFFTLKTIDYAVCFFSSDNALYLMMQHGLF